MVITGALSSLSLGGQVTVAATLVIGALYLHRTANVFRTIAGMFGLAVSYGLVLLVGAAVVIVFGWVDPNPATAADHVKTGARWLWNTGTGPILEVADWARGLIP